VFVETVNVAYKAFSRLTSRKLRFGGATAVKNCAVSLHV
jgi:hypothetical protein